MNTKYFFLQKVFLPEISRYILSFLPKCETYFIDGEFEDILKTQLLDCREKNGCLNGLKLPSYYYTLRDYGSWNKIQNPTHYIEQYKKEDEKYFYTISFHEIQQDSINEFPYLHMNFQITTKKDDGFLDEDDLDELEDVIYNYSLDDNGYTLQDLIHSQQCFTTIHLSNIEFTIDFFNEFHIDAPFIETIRNEPIRYDMVHIMTKQDLWNSMMDIYNIIIQEI
jgi:hypothetical protein